MSIKPLIYRSTDAGAPQLTGQAGSLVAVLDAVLVNGYGVGLNAKAPAGWTLEFSGTNKRVYRNTVAHGTGTYLRIDDTGSEQLAEPRLAWMRAYEAMTDVDTGINPCPTVVQLGRGMQVMKSTAANAASCVWVVVACHRYAYLFIAPQSTTVAGLVGVARMSYFFGDYDSLVPADDFNFLLTGVHGQTYSTNHSAVGGMYAQGAMSSSVSTLNTAWYGLRSYTGQVGALPLSPTVTRWGTSMYGGAGATPNTATGGLLFEQAFLRDGPMLPRGVYPGLLAPLHDRPFGDLEIAPVIPGYEGLRYVAKTVYAGSDVSGFSVNYLGQVLLEAYEHG